MDEVSERLTVGAAARLVGVSVRALHHYDEIGLVEPTGRTSVGYRTYSARDIERLYQVLTYRELGFPLEQIKRLLDDPAVDTMGHLRRQRELLDGQIDRLHQMAAAIDRMMEARTMKIQLTPEEQREIFGDKWLGDEYAAEAEHRWGNTEAWKQSQQRAAQLSKDEWREIKAETDAFDKAIIDALTRGVRPGSSEANALAERHRAAIGHFSDCDYALQMKIAQTYVDDPRLKAYYEGMAPGLAQFLHQVIIANADGK